MSLKPFADDLEREGYSVQPILIPACAIGGPTGGTGFGLLPTVTAQDYKLRGPNGSQQGLPRSSVRCFFLLLPATEIHHRRESTNGNSPMRHPRTANSIGEKKPNGLSDFLDFYGMLLPTPVASDAGVGAVMGKNDRIIVTPKGKIRKINQKGHVWSVGLGEDGGTSVHADGEGLKR